MVRPTQHERCTLAGCKSEHYAKGLCRYHYQRERSRAKVEGRFGLARSTHMLSECCRKPVKEGEPHEYGKQYCTACKSPCLWRYAYPPRSRPASGRVRVLPPPAGGYTAPALDRGDYYFDSLVLPMKKFEPELVALDSLKEHPKNYRGHSDDQIAHIEASIRKNGIYKNVVVAKDGTILAGHGVVKTARKMKLKEIPVIRLPIAPDSTEALRVLAGDNEISRLAEVNDRELSEILKRIKDSAGLDGTGYDEMMLANLVMVTRHESEIKDINEAAEWVGMPAYEEAQSEFKLTINFKNQKDRDKFLELIGQPKANKTRLWWPAKTKSDSKSIRFDK